MNATITLDAVGIRLNRLERQNRLLKHMLFAVVMLAGCATLMAMNYDALPILEAQKLVLRGADGKARCELAIDEQGNVVQTFHDTAGTERIRFAVEHDGNARLRLFDDSGSIRVGASTFSSKFEAAPNQASLAVLGAGNTTGTSEKGGVFLGTQKDGEVFQTIFDKNGTSRLSAVSDASAEMYQWMRDASGRGRIYTATTKEQNLAILSISGDTDEHQCSIELTTNGDGTASQRFFGNTGKCRVSTYCSDNGWAEQRNFDLSGQSRMAAGTDSNGAVYQTLSDSAGKLRVQSFVSPATAPDFENCAFTSLHDREGNMRASTAIFNNGDLQHDFSDVTGHSRISTKLFPSGTAIQQFLDRNGRVRFYNGSFSDGQSGQAFLAANGVCKASTMMNPDDSISQYVEKDAATQAWDAYRNSRDVLQAIQDLNTLGEWLSE